MPEWQNERPDPGTRTAHLIRAALQSLTGDGVGLQVRTPRLRSGRRAYMGLTTEFSRPLQAGRMER